MNRRHRRPSLRTRLTLIYGGLFLVAGGLLLSVTYLLVDEQMPWASADAVSGGQGGANSYPSQTPSSGSGETVTDLPLALILARESARLRHATMLAVLTQGAIALALVGAVAVGLGWVVAGRVLNPLRRVTETARRIAAAPVADRGLRERIALAGRRDEVKDLADSFDTMLERLDKMFEGQRRFVANASHELRTPLTLSRALVEVAMHRKTASADLKQLGIALLEITTRHERLITGLLLLARSESETLTKSEVDLADVVAHVVTQSAADADAVGVDLRGEPASAWTLGEPVLLERLTQNLVDNGLRYNLPVGGFVQVTSRTVAGGVELEVENSGPVIPGYDVPLLFEPFRRLGDDRLATAKGVGLGLSIVRSVARAHGGEVTAHPRDGGGLTVTVTLPGTPKAR